MAGTVSSLGVGSGLDLQGILDSLREVDEQLITKKETEIVTLQDTLDEFDTIEAKVLAMKSYALDLSLSSSFIDRNVTVSDTDVLSATAITGAPEASHAISVVRLASHSSWTSSGMAAKTTSIYVPTTQESTTGLNDTASTSAITADGTMSFTYGSGDNLQTINVAVTANMTLDDVVNAINTDDDNTGAQYITASTFQGTDGDYYLRVAATSGGSGEDNRVAVTAQPTGISLAAPDATFQFSVGTGSPISVTVAADTTLEGLATLINDHTSEPDVTATVTDVGVGKNSYRLVLSADNSGEDSRITIDSQLTDLTLTESQGAGGAPPTSDSAVTPITIDATNNILNFSVNTGGGLGSEITATVSAGSYSAESLAEALETAMETADSGTDYSVTYSNTSDSFSITGSDLTELQLLWNTGSDTATTIGSVMGFDTTADDTGSTNYTADNAITPFTIDGANNTIVFQELANGGSLTSDITATIASGSYSSDDLATAVETALETASAASGNSINYWVAWDSSDQKFVIREEDGPNLDELYINWDDAASTAETTLGFDATQDSYKPLANSLNAEIDVNGITYQRQANEGLTDVLQGVTLNLTKTGSASVTVSTDKDTIKEKITGLVDAYNDLFNEIKNNSVFDPETGDSDDDDQETSLLIGYSTVTGLDDDLAALLSLSIDTGGSITSLFDLGFEVERGGTVKIDEDTLDTKLSSGMEDIIKLFAGDDDNNITGLAETLNDRLREITSSTGVIGSEKEFVQDEIDDLEEQIEEETDRLDRRYETLSQQFVQLDIFSQQMQAQSAFLTNMFNPDSSKS